MGRTTIGFCALLAGLGLLAGHGEAQVFKQPEETLPGFKAHSVYERRGIENLSLFNGDPQLAVPLGPEYPLGYGLSFQLTAHYSTRFWHMYQTACGSDQYGVPESHGRARVRGLPTLGLGWTLELGAVDPAPWPAARTRYFAEDGRIHEFAEPAFGVLQEPEDGGPIRLSKRPGGGYIIHFADGTTHWLTHEYHRPDPRAGWGNTWDFTDVDGAALARRTTRWGLKQIRDRNDNIVAEVDWDEIKSWRMQSIKMPLVTRAIDFHWTTHTPSGQSVSWDVLGSISFPVLANPVSTLNVTMAYHSSGQFQRSAFEEYWLSGCEALAPTDVHLPFLASISQHTDVTSFSYVLDGTDPSEYGLDTAAGVLSGYALPTGLNVRFHYQRSTAPIPCLFGTRSGCTELDEPAVSVGETQTVDPADRLTRLHGYLDRCPAVVSRAETDPTSGGLVATTSYERSQFAQPVGTQGEEAQQRDPARVLRRVIVRRPSGNGGLYATRHVFHVLTEPVPGWDGWGENPVTSGPGLEVERRAYASSLARGTPVRSSVMCYDGTFVPPYVTYCGALDVSGEIAEFPQGFSHMQPSREVTWYGANPLGGGECRDDTATEVACHHLTRTGWRAAALEFESVTVGAPKQGPSAVFLQGDQRWRRTTTTWDPRSGATPWLHWQPKLYTSRTVEDVYGGECPFPSCSVTTTTAFDPVSGALGSSTVSGGGLSRTTTLSYTDGDPTSETVSGIGLSGTYQTIRTFQNGLVTTSRRTQPADPGWLQLHVVRDAALGLATTSYDPNGLPTTYSWDPLGRLAGIGPPGGEHPTTICYTAWNDSNPGRGASALVRKGSSTSCDTNAAVPAEGSETVAAYLYDGSGRSHREIRLLPNTTAAGTYPAMRVTERNAVGLVTAVTEWVPCGSGTDLATCFGDAVPETKKTTYSSFDPFGRARSIILPDGTAVSRGYDDWDSGVAIPSSETWEDTTTSNVAGGAVFQGIRRDLLGRILLASEPVLSPPGDLPLTSYLYDIHDGLALVAASRTIAAGTTVTQERRFRRNALGYLTWARDPESGETTWSSFDALGNAGKKTNDGVTVDSDYDALGRLIGISSGGVTYSTIHYDGNEPDAMRSDKFRGRLTKRIGHNPASVENARVEDTYYYSDAAGRLTSRVTDFFRAGVVSQAFASLTRDQTWNSLGLPQTRELSGAGTSLQTTTYYTAGAPTRIMSGAEALVSSVTYHPHGGLASYTTGNGVTASLLADPHGMARPSRIRTTGASATFDTGVFTYDGAGNVTRMQPAAGSPDLLTYDRLSRLKTATWGSVPTSPGESFFYDGENEEGFGSLIRITGNGAGIPPDVLLPTDPATNRLSAGTYDALGNLVSFPLGSGSSETFTYDALSRRTSDSRFGALTSWHLYDAEGERVARVLPTTSTSSSALRFFTVTPCRLLDTRNPTGPYGGPYLTGGQPREFTAVGQCGVASGARAIVGNLTTVPRPDAGGVTGTHSWGFLKLYPADFPTPVAAAGVINPAKVRAQFNFGKLSTGGAFRLLADIPATETVDTILDVSGYFAPASGPSTVTEWLLTQRDDANRPVADWKWRQETSTLSPQAFHVFLGSMKVASRELSSTPEWYFYSSDHLGTPRLKTGPKPQGAPSAPVVETYRYRAFGEAFAGLTPANRPGFEFAMMERDPILPEGAPAASGSGHHYVHARFFADRFARFLSPDQVSGSPEDPQSWNRYTYARNNPLKYVDPDGRSAMAAIQRLPLLLPLLPTLGVPAGLAPLVAAVSLVALEGYAGGRGVGEFMAHSPSLIPVRLAPDVVMLSAKPDTHFGEKIEGQLGPRGWTQEDVGNTIANPASTAPARDTRRKPDGTRNDAPATRYTNPDGSYVVRNDETGDIVQVSNRNDPKWKAPTDSEKK